jgi:hypothetical protein
MSSRIGIAWKAMNELKNLWASPVNNNIKLNCFRALIESILLYGSETWTMTTAMVKKMDGTYTKMLRKALGVHWSEHMENTKLYGNIPRCSTTILKRSLSFIGHLFRENCFAAGLLCKTTGVKKVGRPHLSYGCMLSRDTGLELSQLVRDAKDRVKWNRFVNSS